MKPSRGWVGPGFRRDDGNLPKLLAAFCVCLLAAVIAVAGPASALEVEVTNGQIQPLPIALPNFLGDSPDTQKFGADITGVISNDLAHSGFFKPLPPQSFIEQVASFDQEPRFGDWRQIQAKALVTGIAT